MRFKEWEDYLDSMLSHVKFSPDRHKIRQEFVEHMEDMFDEYSSEGMSDDEARDAVLDNIGDSHEVGKLMNKAHNAVIGWIWQAMKYCLVIVVICCTSTLSPLTANLLEGLHNISMGYVDIEAHGEYVYSIELDETVTVDNHKLKFDKLIKYADRGTNEFVICYREYKKLQDCGIDRELFWLTEDMFTDDLGEMPDEVTETITNVGFLNYTQVSVTGFSGDAKQIIIEYKGNEQYYKGRHFVIVIDLPEDEGATT